MSNTPPSGYCTSVEDGKPCTCKKYKPSNARIAGQPTFCARCAHGLSRHKGGVQKSESWTGAVLKTLHGLDVDTQKLSEARMETNLYRSKGFQSAKDSSKAGQGKSVRIETSCALSMALTI